MSTRRGLPGRSRSDSPTPSPTLSACGRRSSRTPPSLPWRCSSQGLARPATRAGSTPRFVLNPGRLAVVYAGHLQLDREMSLLERGGLTYMSHGANVLNSRHTRVRVRIVFGQHRSVLFYSAGPYRARLGVSRTVAPARSQTETKGDGAGTGRRARRIDRLLHRPPRTRSESAGICVPCGRHGPRRDCQPRRQQRVQISPYGAS
jgi:hypothetical protein